jgi:hypothetical protein
LGDDLVHVALLWVSSGPARLINFLTKPYGRTQHFILLNQAKRFRKPKRLNANKQCLLPWPCGSFDRMLKGRH